MSPTNTTSVRPSLPASRLSAAATSSASDGSETRIAVHSGFIEVANDHLTLLSDVSEMAEDIDVDRARAALERAEEALRADGDDVEAAAAKARAMARLTAVQGDA